MTTTFDDKEIHQDTDEEALRRLLGLGPARTVVYDDGELIERCPECGHWPPPIHEPVPLPPGEPVTDVVPDLSAMRAAVRTVRLLVDVLDQRRQRSRSPIWLTRGCCGTSGRSRCWPVGCAVGLGCCRCVRCSCTRVRWRWPGQSGSRGGGERSRRRSSPPGWTGGCARRCASCERRPGSSGVTT
jgi:hypothetical protein